MAIELMMQTAAVLGVNTAVLLISIVVISVWEVIWTGLAMWTAAKKKNKILFVIFLVVNLLAIPEIVYFIVTRKKEMPAIKKKRK